MYLYRLSRFLGWPDGIAEKIAVILIILLPGAAAGLIRRTALRCFGSLMCSNRPIGKCGSDIVTEHLKDTGSCSRVVFDKETAAGEYDEDPDFYHLSGPLYCGNTVFQVTEALLDYADKLFLKRHIFVCFFSTLAEMALEHIACLTSAYIVICFVPKSLPLPVFAIAVILTAVYILTVILVISGKIMKAFTVLRLMRRHLSGGDRKKCLPVFIGCFSVCLAGYISSAFALLFSLAWYICSGREKISG